MITLVLTLVIGGNVQAASAIDNMRFDSIAACEAYKARMQYKDTEHLIFTCTK